MTVGPGLDTKLRTGPLDRAHRAARARFAPFGGWDLPVFFTGILDEHKAVRERAGLFDVSHLGRVVIEGEGAARAAASVLTCDPPSIPVGRGRYCLSLTGNGGIADDLIVYRPAESRFVVVPNAANTPKIVDALKASVASSSASDSQTVTDVTVETAMLALQGPRSGEVLSALGVQGREERYAVSSSEVAGAPVTVFRSGYTGEQGVEIMCPAGDAERVWGAVIGAGEEFGVARCGLGARDTLRLEMGYPLWGQDIDETTSPVEAGLMFAVNMRNESFTGRRAVEEALRTSPQRLLVALEVTGGIARRADPLLAGEERVGAVTSGTFSPSLREGIALGYVDVRFTKAGTTLTVDIRGRRRQATVVEKPFYRST